MTFVDPGYQSPLDAAVSERDRGVLQMVQRAIETRNVVLAYQPVIQAQRTGKIAFWEGLLRVLDETGRVVPAKDFIEVAETREMGRQLDCLSLEMGLRALAQTPDLRLSINMSARSIGYPRWSAILDRGLAADPTVGERLILEITESSAMVVPEIVTSFMDRLQVQGVAFALDDFGAGHTAFRYFRDFFFDIIKIDGQFAQNISNSIENNGFVKALIDIANLFGVKTVVEWVEDSDTAEALRGLGVDYLQGFTFGQPLAEAPWASNEQVLIAGHASPPAA